MFNETFIFIRVHSIPSSWFIKFSADFSRRSLNLKNLNCQSKSLFFITLFVQIAVYFDITNVIVISRMKFVWHRDGRHDRKDLSIKLFRVHNGLVLPLKGMLEK